MGGLPIAFGAPALLFGLLALPVIWWLLRLTPPRPQAEPFAPLAILARVLKTEETPAHSPWWLTALRLLVAGMVILALSEPVLNPRDASLAGDGPLVLMIDNSWAAAPDWDARVSAAEMLIADAETSSLPVSIAFTADRRNDATPGTADHAREQLLAAAPRPARPERNATVGAVIAGLDGARPGTMIFLSDGIATSDSEEALTRLLNLKPTGFRLLESSNGFPVAVIAAANGSDALEVTASRLSGPAAETAAMTASDIRGHDIAAGQIDFAADEGVAGGTISTPFELRNDIARIAVGSTQTAGGVWLLDDSFRRRRVALISGESADIAQPLLSPLYYIDRALAPYADLIKADSADLGKAIPSLIAQNPAVIVMADIGILPSETGKALEEWINRGGTLIRFAGPRLAAAPADDPLVPVQLRKGERELGGTLSWIEPQPLAGYPASSPFAGLPAPQDVTVSRQVLAEPSADLAARTWASLADGTPLVTAAERGSGRIVLFHVTAAAGWSNLPISGHFVDMLRRVVQLSHAVVGKGGAASGILPPWRLLDARGGLVPASGDAKPLDLTAAGSARASADNPPGLYGTEDGFVAVNLFGAGDTLEPLTLPDTDVAVSRQAIAGDTAFDFKPWLFGAALLGLLIDTLIVLVMGGAARRFRVRGAATAAMLVLAAGLMSVPQPARAQAAQDSQPGDAEILDRLDRTHLAYVITGDDDLDRTSRLGLTGLSNFLTNHTALEPGDAVGVDIESDQLSFYPLIYWPMSDNSPMPSAAAISRVDAYMKNGGSILFDTRDRIADIGGGGTSPETQKLQAILADLDIPPLEPVPADHVLTKSFFLLDSFPGRYADGPLWVEALPEQTDDGARPARAGDGVSSILITGNDMAGAWAIDENGTPLFSTVPPDPWQREYAYRAGVNIVMYMLTGNYKSDQVHIPALLERLGQ